MRSNSCRLVNFPWRTGRWPGQAPRTAFARAFALTFNNSYESRAKKVSSEMGQGPFSEVTSGKRSDRIHFTVTRPRCRKSILPNQARHTGPLAPTTLAYGNSLNSETQPFLGWCPNLGKNILDKSVRDGADLLQFSPAPVAPVANHPCDRALLRRSAPPYPAHSLLRQRRQRGPAYLCHLQRNEREV